MRRVRAHYVSGEAPVDINPDETICGCRPACMNTDAVPAPSKAALTDQWEMSKLSLVEIKVVARGIRALWNTVLKQHRRACHPFLVELAQGCLGRVNIREVFR